MQWALLVQPGSLRNKKATVLHETSGFRVFFKCFFLLKNLFLVLLGGILEHSQGPESFI